LEPNLARSGRLGATLLTCLVLVFWAGAAAASEGESAFQEGTRLQARAALLEVAGQNDQALELYHQAWRAFPHDAIVGRIVRLARSAPVDRELISFLLTAAEGLTDDAVRAELDKYLEEVLPEFKARHGRLKVLVFPPAARVVVASRAESFRVRSGESLWLEPGVVTLRASAPEHKSVKRAITVDPASDKSALVVLEPAATAGQVTLTTKPEGAEVALDGIPLGKSPVRDLRVRPGTHTATARMKGHMPGRQTIRVELANPIGVLLELKAVRKVKRDQSRDQVRTVVPVAGARTALGTGATRPPGGSASRSPDRPRLGIPGRPVHRRTNPWKTAGWVTFGTGVAVAVGGLTLNVLSFGKATDARNLNIDDFEQVEDYDERYDALLAEAQQMNQLALVGYGVGAAAVAGGLAMVFLSKDPAKKASWQFVPIRAGGLLQATARF